MRRCPKCGTTYADSDLRTLCSACMVGLEQVADTDANAMDQPGPITLGDFGMPSSGPVAMPTAPELPPPPSLPADTGPIAPPPPPTLPEVSLPEVNMPEAALPEMTLPEAPPPVLPDVPAPMEAPGPVPAPALPPPLAETSLPDLLPEVKPPTAPPDEVRLTDLVPGMEPVQAPPPAPPRVQPPVAPPPTAPATGRVPLSTEALTAARARSGSLGCFAAIMGVIATVALFRTGENFSFFTLLVVGGLVFAAVLLIRQAIYSSAISEAVLEPQSPLVLGGVGAFLVRVGVLRLLPVTDVEVTVSAQERVVKKGDNDNTTVLRHPIFTHTAPVAAPPQWEPGHEVRFHVPVAIPADVPPSFEGKHHFIEWSAALWVGIPGWYPDVRLRVPLRVPAQRYGPPLVVQEQSFHLPELRDMQARLTLKAGRNSESLPVLPAGVEVPFALTIHPTADGPRQRILLELTYRTSSAAKDEYRMLASVVPFPDGWVAGSPQRVEGTLRLPAEAPISYEGRHFSILWTLTVRQEVPRDVDRRQVIPIQVVPQDLPTPAGAPPPREERKGW